MKAIRCNLKKQVGFSQLSLNGDTVLKIQEISPVYRRIICSSISLVYARSSEFVSILMRPSFKGL